MTSASDSLLAAVRTRVVIDVDSMDAGVASTHAPVANFSDMTSNQAIAHSAALRPENSLLLDAAITVPTSPTAEDVQDVLDRFTVFLAASVLPHISGRVHAQVSPKAAYSTEGTVTHARRLVQLFADRGISRDRVCIKIPATPESMLACAELEKEGIRTLATCLFSLPQALAAVQAGCLYVAPYFNELAAHFTPNLWKDYPSPSHDHPSSPIIHSITTAFRSLNAKTLVMPASIVTAREVLGLLALRPDHLTLSPAVLAELASTPAASLPLPDPLPPLAKDSRVETDYLVDGASALREAIESDRECARKLADALRIFGEEEDALGALVRARIAAARG